MLVKKVSSLLVMIIAVIIFSECSSSRKTVAPRRKLNYQADIQTLVLANCSPCHIPAKGGRKLALDNYAALNKNIDEIIRRIQLNPGEKGYMPNRNAKLSDSTINIFKQWKADGLLEK